MGATGLKDQMSYYVSHLPGPCLIPFPGCVLNPAGCAEWAVAEGVIRKTQGVYQGWLQSWCPGEHCRKERPRRMGLVLRLRPSGPHLVLRLLVMGSKLH